MGDVRPWHFVEEDADRDAGAWEVLPAVGGGIHVRAWNDDRSAHDNLILRRAGAMIVCELPPIPDVMALPLLEPVAHLIGAKRRLLECGFQGDLPPIVIHTNVAEAIWPVFGGQIGPRPVAGVAYTLGVMLAWAPELDGFVNDE